MAICAHCGRDRTIKNRRTCSSCKHRIYRKNNPEKYRQELDKQHAKERHERKSCINLAHWIFRDSQRSDRKHGRLNDLDKEWIDEQIKKPCTYCGDSELRKTLDRVDNSKGHLKENVVVACIRCNYSRKDMPYEAWLRLAPGLKSAREDGLFGDWTGRCK